MKFINLKIALGAAAALLAHCATTQGRVVGGEGGSGLRLGPRALYSVIKSLYVTEPCTTDKCRCKRCQPSVQDDFVNCQITLKSFPFISKGRTKSISLPCVEYFEEDLELNAYPNLVNFSAPRLKQVAYHKENGELAGKVNIVGNPKLKNIDLSELTMVAETVYIKLNPQLSNLAIGELDHSNKDPTVRKNVLLLISPFSSRFSFLSFLLFSSLFLNCVCTEPHYHNPSILSIIY